MPRKMASTTHLTDGTSLSVNTSSVFWSCLISLYYIVQMFLNFTAKLLKSWFLYLLFLLKTCMVFLIPSGQLLILYTKSGQDYCIPQPFNPLNAELNPICHLLALLGAHHILQVSKVRVIYTIHQTLITKHHTVCMSKTVIK